MKIRETGKNSNVRGHMKIRETGKNSNVRGHTKFLGGLKNRGRKALRGPVTEGCFIERPGCELLVPFKIKLVFKKATSRDVGGFQSDNKWPF